MTPALRQVIAELCEHKGFSMSDIPDEEWEQHIEAARQMERDAGPKALTTAALYLRAWISDYGRQSK